MRILNMKDPTNPNRITVMGGRRKGAFTVGANGAVTYTDQGAIGANAITSNTLRTNARLDPLVVTWITSRGGVL